MGLIAKHRVNMLMLGSTMLQMLLAEPNFDIQVLRKMEWFIFSCSAIPMRILKTIRQYCPNTGSPYGLNEYCVSVDTKSVVPGEGLSVRVSQGGRGVNNKQ